MIEYNEKKAVQTEEPDIKPTKLFRRYRPKYLKKPEKRKSLRALTCFALVFAALMTSAVGTYAKYISPPVEIPSLSIQAAQFACKVEDLTINDNEKANYGLDDKDVVVQAFTVSNEKNGVRSEVDLSVDVNLAGLSGKYWAEFDWDTLSFAEKDRENVSFVKGLKSKLIVGELNAFGNFEALDTQPEPESISNSSQPGIMQIALFDVTADCHNEWKDAFSIPCDTKHTYVGIIVIDTNVVDSTSGALTYTGPDLELTGTTNNLTVTVNQAKASA